MNIVMKNNALTTSEGLPSSSSVVRQGLNADPRPKPHPGKKAQSSSQSGTRVFGRELQNQRPAEPKSKALDTPSTEHSARLSGTGSGESRHTKRANPQMASAYQSRIKEFLCRRDREQRVDAKALGRQKDINGKMRGILVDWLVDVAGKFKLLGETLFAAVCLLDRYLERKQVPRAKLQLVGISCLMVMAKFEEIYPPGVRDFVCVCDRAYSHEQLLDTEADILQALQFDLALTPSLVFYREMAPGLRLSPKPLVFGEYLLETALLSEHASKFSQRELACGALFLVNKIFKCRKGFAPDLAPLMPGVPESRVKGCAKELYKVLGAVSDSGLSAIKRKFASVEKLEVSKYKIERASKGKRKPKKTK